MKRWLSRLAALFGTAEQREARQLQETASSILERYWDQAVPPYPEPVIQSEAPAIIVQRPAGSPITIEHDQSPLHPFVVNGQFWGWAYKNDPKLIIDTLTATAVGNC